MFESDKADVRAVLLQDGWHRVHAFDLDEYGSYLMAASWLEQDDVRFSCPITSIRALRYD